MREKVYLAIDLKSFYASVECADRGLDPLNTFLVVADHSRTNKTICLAVSPALKELGVPGRPRLFEVEQIIRRLNKQRLQQIPGFSFDGTVTDKRDVTKYMEISYVTAVPRMQYYIDYSTKIYQIYLRYIAPEDIHVYSIDEVFIDATAYLTTYGLSAHDLAMKIMREVLQETGITATCGIGTNLYLAKVAMDIVAKHMKPDEYGVRIAYLDEELYKEKLWSHRPLTDFWRVGRGISQKLESHGLYTMGDIARASVSTGLINEELLYTLFGINAELLIDHAWGYEPTTLQAIKSYQPSAKSISSGQVLPSAYTFEKAKLVLMEMTELLCLDMMDKGFVTNHIVIYVGYDLTNLTDTNIDYQGSITTDYYGRNIPKHAQATIRLNHYTSSIKYICDEVSKAFHQNVNANLLIRRLNVTAADVQTEESAKHIKSYTTKQLDLLSNHAEEIIEENKQEEFEEKEKQLMKAMLQIKKKHGKNSIIKGRDMLEGATLRERNDQIGGHKA